MSIYGQLQGFEQQWVTLYELDATKYGLGVFRFHAGVNQKMEPVVWQGNTYQPVPMESDGWALRGDGGFARPKVRFANVEGVITDIAVPNNDLIGCKFTRKRTMAMFLDAVNFVNGNPSADPNEHLMDDVYIVAQKTAENNRVVEFELNSPIDMTGVFLPRRTVIANLCTFEYRGEECGYTGGPCADRNDNLTTDPSKDSCGKRLKSCKIRFGEYGELSYGGFPASSLIPR